MEIKDIYGNVLKEGDRVSWNLDTMGFGELGTITKIERSTTTKDGKEVLWGDEFNYTMWVRWDCHGCEIGECISDYREGSHSWILYGSQSKLFNLKGGVENGK